MLKSTTREDGCSRLAWIQFSWTTCEKGCLRYERIALTRQSRNYHVITTNHPTIRARERQLPVPTQCETSRNTPHARNWKITRALLTPCCSLGSLCVSVYSLVPPRWSRHGGGEDGRPPSGRLYNSVVVKFMSISVEEWAIESIRLFIFDCSLRYHVCVQLYLYLLRHLHSFHLKLN
jgi:hypothetical protein